MNHNVVGGHGHPAAPRQLRRPTEVNAEPLRRPMDEQQWSSDQYPTNAAQMNAGYVLRPAFNTNPSVSTLSPNAAEFIPSAVYRPAFIPMNPAMIVPPVVAVPPAVDLENHPAVADLRQAIFTLTINPGKFHSRVPSLTSILNSSVKDDQVLEYIVQVIFDQSIDEPNFRYTGARLCDHLHKNLSANISSKDLRSHLLFRCQQEYKAQMEINSKDNESKLRLQGFVMFMAELFINMEVGEKKEKLEKIAQVLPKLIIKLADDAADNSNFKYLCHVVKLSGACLEQFEKEKSGRSQNMDELFAVIQQHVHSSKLNSITKEMLQKVVDLRQSEWGKLSPTSTSTKQLDFNSSTSSGDGIVFYGPDGIPLSNEETQFLQSSQQDDASNNETGDESEAEEYNCGMDEEMYDAFEEFLAESSTR